MTPFATNLILAFVWAALNGGIGVSSVLVGFLVGYAVLFILQPLFGASRYCSSLFDGVMLALYFIYELIISSLKVAWDVLTPTHRSKPALIAVPIEAKTDAEITVLANLVSLTPGSLSVDISEDKTHLLVHAMFVDDPEAFKQELHKGMERRVLEAMR
ncbi:Na+/H+ antiporter subunit E [Leucothrix pacifica]|uniref:Sodium:proton antiporter n=1 Tax=Leucothrix pacifica TaxID=1247513 RepID=A0A317CT02_9GAMM|nr:Na+/H+ antiporter subunit E [Leucothrix pacifica]PWR00644.1 sodium:proton antiporter [Leucothrix pacifica]